MRGIAVGTRGQTSFSVHLPMAIAVGALAWWLGVSRIEGTVLIVCVTIVLAAEFFNSALEHLAKAITSETNSEVRDALDIASGAVLVMSIGAAIVGLVVLGRPLLEELGIL